MIPKSPIVFLIQPAVNTLYACRNEMLKKKKGKKKSPKCKESNTRPADYLSGWRADHMQVPFIVGKTLVYTVCEDGCCAMFSSLYSQQMI